ncbi:uncharacterized protein LOC142570380 [Dermacentor variabilis]|uniref:uncharacterized protein LOC142570380 n=1 Tax=Dermacentor variabilis TaxID=34621 RepID=UPI003F5C922E
MAHQFDGTKKELLEVVRNRYINPAGPEPLPDYGGGENSELDAPITLAEVRAEINRLRTKSAAGPDRVSNKMLRNLDDSSIANLATYMQECWEKGTIPQEWKLANLIFIPKPGKKLGFENLRPISLTSCVGKLMEHVVLTRLNRYMEENGLYPDTMIGFRPKLSACDVMLQLKDQIIDKQTRDTKVIVGLDVAKAFDNVRHVSILENLNSLNVGKKVYDYIKDFLTNRKATLKIGEESIKSIDLGNVGTPQGSVLSPTLFNIAMLKLPERLGEIENLNHTIYADDLTLWINKGSDGQIESSLQNAIDIIEEYLKPKGLKCSAEKSEVLFLMPPGKRRLHQKREAGIHLYVNGAEIPAVDSIRVLGLRIQANRKNYETLARLEASSNQTCRLIRRIANRHAGMKEANLLRLAQAFVISRIVYVAPYLKLSSVERNKLEIIIRKSVKVALGLPPNTPTGKLMKLGVSNTLEELIQAAVTAQHQRLHGSKTGRKILEKLGYEPKHEQVHSGDIPRHIRDKIKIPPLPRNMNPAFHDGRRKDRAEALQARYTCRQDVLYTDAAEYESRAAHAAVAVREDGTPVACCTVSGVETVEAEEVAIALALSQRGVNVVISDSKNAVRNYESGRVTETAIRILNREGGPRQLVLLVWAPAHQGLRGNEEAHSVARGLTYRSTPGSSQTTETINRREDMRAYQEIIAYYRLNRQIYPGADRTLSKKDEVIWRKLQMGVFPNPVLYSKWQPGVFRSKCKFCDEAANLVHMVWTCPAKNDSSRTLESWEALLRSPDPNVQRDLIGQALAAAVSQGIPADG